MISVAGEEHLPRRCLFANTFKGKRINLFIPFIIFPTFTKSCFMRLTLYDKHTLDHSLADSFAMGMRLGYVLADAVLWGGGIGYYYNLVSNAASANNKEMMAALEHLDDKQMFLLDDVKKLFKTINKINSKDTKMMLARRQAEKTLDMLHKSWIQQLAKSLHTVGLPRIDGELFDGITFHVYQQEPSNPEAENNKNIPLSSIFHGSEEEEDDVPDIPFLPPAFLKSDYVQNALKAVDDPQAAQPGSLFLHPLCTLPNLTMLTEKELSLLRKQVAAPGAAFRKIVDDWWHKCIADNDYEKRITFFANEVSPLSQQMEQLLTHHPLIEAARNKQSPGYSIEVLIGEVPVELVYRFYADEGVITEPTLKVLTKWLENETHRQRRWPVVVANWQEESIPNDLAEEQTEEMLTRKKFISF